MSERQRKTIWSSIKKDVNFLRCMGLMDYSLLLAIERTPPPFNHIKAQSRVCAVSQDITENALMASMNIFGRQFSEDKINDT